MDWTGGSRRRYAQKGKGNGELQKQKQYFAKARAAATQQAQRAPFTNYMQVADASSQHNRSMPSPKHVSVDRNSHDHQHSLRSVMDRETRRAGAVSHTRRSCSGSSDAGRSNQRTTAPQYRSSVDELHKLKSGTQSVSVANISEVDRLLMANRKRLLARKDWLGLSASRPVTYQFPSSRDKDRIGKRRKIDRSAPHKHHPHPARQRPMAPLFNHKLPLNDHFMSGALPDEDIQIKIGTDAFESQTQPSRRSRASINTSMRQPSTDYTNLSEESMLLGVDGDGFEIEVDNPTDLQPAEPGNLPREFSSGIPEPSFHDSDQLAFLADSREPSPAYGGIETTLEPQSKHYYHDPSPEARSHTIMSSTLPRQATPTLPKDTTSMQLSKPPKYGAEMTHTALREHSSPEVPEKDEQVWRKLMQLEEAASGHASMMALDSSSLHATQSTASAWHPIQIPPTVPEARFDLGGRHEVYACAEEPRNAVTESEKGSPRDEQLWREFVLGSQDSDISASGNFSTLHAIDGRARTDSSTPGAAIEQLRSDRVTLGGSVFAHDNSNDESYHVDEDPYETAGVPTNTSMIGHATEVDQDEIEGSYADDMKSYTTGNIHASSSASVLNPKRFKRPTKQNTFLAHKSSRFKFSMSTDNKISPRSVYDITD